MGGGVSSNTLGGSSSSPSIIALTLWRRSDVLHIGREGWSSGWSLAAEEEEEDIESVVASGRTESKIFEK